MMIQQIIMIVGTIFLVSYICLLLYYLQAWLKAPTFLQEDDLQLNLPFLSIIIAARNEEDNLPGLLTDLLNQSFQKENFEVIVVDDHSTDNTAGIIKKRPSVKYISLQDHMIPGETFAFKKKAIEVAIQQAKGELIITTDADCSVPKNWLQTIARFYMKTGSNFIVMPVRMQPGNSALGIFQSLDFMVLQGITGAAVHKKFHSMCNGANLAYTKKAFDQVGGFTGINHIASGDDMLLMHKIYKLDAGAVYYLKSQEVMVSTHSEKTIGQFFKQRIRWASKSDHYQDKSIFLVLLLVYLFNLYLLLLLIYLIFQGNHFLWKACLSFVAIKTAVELIFLYPVARFFNQKVLFLFFPLAQPFHIIYTVIAGFLGKFGSYQWKGRQLK
ncbi:MAG TPA: glycosyltransferase [Ferruginibacter sp.]|nr:glycosyltransferase [Niastella sp.]HRB31075.1 glycosyltransferase [Ferruginibacter sp.]